MIVIKPNFIKFYNLLTSRKTKGFKLNIVFELRGNYFRVEEILEILIWILLRDLLIIFILILEIITYILKLYWDPAIYRHNIENYPIID